MAATKVVLVTGASTGIGRKTTERLAAEGHFVYAGARKDSDLQALGSIKNVEPLPLDVTQQRDISAAVDAVTKRGRGLYGLVNNAGLGTRGPVINGNDTEFDLLMAVNVHGPYRISKAFAPLIIAEKGRIVMIGSISGILAERDVSAYSMSKHAIEAFTDSLALELGPLGVQVSVVEPGVVNTEIFNNAIRRIGSVPGLPDLSRKQGLDDVVRAITLAMFEPKPKRRYLVVSDEQEAHRVIKKQIAKLVQLNEGHPYTYQPDALVKTLREALVHSRPRVL